MINQTSVSSESLFPSSSSSSSLPELPRGLGWGLEVSSGSSMFIVVASEFAASKVAPSPNSETKQSTEAWRRFQTRSQVLGVKLSGRTHVQHA